MPDRTTEELLATFKTLKVVPANSVLSQLGDYFVFSEPSPKFSDMLSKFSIRVIFLSSQTRTNVYTCNLCSLIDVELVMHSRYLIMLFPLL